MTKNDTLDGKTCQAGKGNVLLLGGRASDAEEIRRDLRIFTRLGYAAWHCSRCEEATDFLRRHPVKIDIIFLDLRMGNAHSPRDHFRQVKAGIPDIPIVVLTDRADRSLISFVMAAGAADSVFSWQLRNDPDRLKEIIETCRARHDLAGNGAVLRLMQGESASNLRLVGDDISLRNDNDGILKELKVMRDKGIADLPRAYDSEVAGSKEKAARGPVGHYNDYARYWIAEGDSGREHAEEQNDDEKLLN